MKKFMAISFFVLAVALGLCFPIASATGNGVLYVSDLCVKDSNQEFITDIRDAFKGETCYVQGNISNSSSNNKDVTFFVASYDNDRLTDVFKETYSIPANGNKSISMEFTWNLMATSDEEKLNVFVLDAGLSPISEKLEIGYLKTTGLFVTANKVYEEDFEDGMPDEWLNSTNGYKTCEIYEESNGNKMLLLNAASSIIQTPRFLSKSKNVAVTADFYQNGSTGANISAVGFGRYDLGGDISHRFMYYDVVRASDRVRDVFGYSVAEAGILADTYTHKDFSSEAGILNQTSRETEPFSMTMGYYNGTIFCHAENEQERVLWDYSTETETDKFLFDDMIHQTDGFVITSHSATAYVDNIVAYEVAKSDKLILQLPEHVMINEWYELVVKGIGENEEEFTIPLDNITFKYDKSAVEIKDGKIRFLNGEEQTIRAFCNDPITQGEGRATTNVKAVASVDKLEFNNLADAYKLGEEIILDIDAYSGNEKVESDAYVITCDGQSVNGTTITGLSDGEHTIKATLGDVSKEQQIYVSKYSDANLSKTDYYYVGKTYDVALNGVTSGSTERISNYIADYDESALSINDGKITALKPGLYEVEFMFDNISAVAEVNIIPDVGVTIMDDFENPQNKTQYLNYDINDVVYDGTNKVLMLENETTDLTMHDGLARYTLSGKFKIEPESIDADAYNAGFEIVTRRVTNDMFGAKHKGVHFMYSPDGNGSAEMRIGPVRNHKLISENGQWHDFSVTMYDKVCVFNVDGNEMLINSSTTMTAGFYIISNNCKIMLDDVSVTRTPTSNEAITAKVFQDTLNPYEVYNMANVAALKRGESNVYINPDSVTWIASENSSMELTDGILTFKDGISDGEYTITAIYANKEYPIKVIVGTPDMTKAQYVMSTVENRQKDYAFRISENCDTYGVDFTKNELSYLPGLYAKMLIYPKLTDYSDALIWHVNDAQYQDTIVGRGNDGGDFVMLQLIMAYKELYGELNATQQAWDFVKEYLTGVNYAREGDSHTENHQLVHYAAALLTAEAWPDSNVSGESASVTHTKYKQYLKNWYNKAIKRGLGEYNSAHYMFIDTYALEILYTYTNDAEIQNICSNLLNYIYADGLDNNIDDNLGGATLRAYAYKDMTTRFAGFKRMFNLGDYVIDDRCDFANLQISQSFASAFRPIELLFDQAMDTNRRYDNLETSETYHLPHNVEWDSFVTRYTHVTPDYVLGSRINYIAPTNPGNIYDLNCHQEMPWSVQLGSKSSRLILGGLQSNNTQTSRTYWMSSKGQNTFKLMQNKNMLVGVYELTNESKFVHYRIPKNEFKNIDEENGWIFIDDDDVYVAFKPVATAYAWSTDSAVSGQIALSQSEIKVTDKYSGFVLQTVDKTEYSGTYEQFKADILANTTIKAVFTNDECSLTYTGINGTDSVGVDYKNNKLYKNGNVYTPDTSKLHSSPYLNANVDEGIITMTYGGKSHTIRLAE